MYYLVETGKRCLAARKKMARGTTDAELSGFIAKSLCKSLLFRWILKAGVKCTHEPGRTSTVQAERHTMLDNVIHSKYKINIRERENTTVQLKPTRRCSVLHVDFFYFRAWYWYCIGIGVCRAQSLPSFSIGEGAFLGCFRPERLLVRLLLPRAFLAAPPLLCRDLLFGARVSSRGSDFRVCRKYLRGVERGRRPRRELFITGADSREGPSKHSDLVWQPRHAAA